MRIELILTLVVALLFIFFGFFNTGIIEINLCGLGVFSVPVGLLVFLVFLIGAVYGSILSVSRQIRQELTIRHLKKEINEFKKASNDQIDKPDNTILEEEIIPETSPGKESEL